MKNKIVNVVLWLVIHLAIFVSLFSFSDAKGSGGHSSGHGKAATAKQSPVTIATTPAPKLIKHHKSERTVTIKANQK